MAVLYFKLISLSLYLCLVVHVPARADAQDSNLISPLMPLHSLNFCAKLCIYCMNFFPEILHVVTWHLYLAKFYHTWVLFPKFYQFPLFLRITLDLNATLYIWDTLYWSTRHLIDQFQTLCCYKSWIFFAVLINWKIFTC